MQQRPFPANLTDQLLRDFPTTLGQLQSIEANQLLPALTQQLQQEAIRVRWHLAALISAPLAILGFLLVPLLLDDFLSVLFALVLQGGIFIGLCLTPIFLFVLSRLRRRPEYREKILRLLSGGRREVLARIVEPCLKRARAEHLSLVLPLCQALEKKHWWESPQEKRARFVAVSTLHSLLGAATEGQIAAFTPEENAYLKRELTRWLGKKTGWYLDTELPIRFFLVLGSARFLGLETMAEETVQSHTEPRLVEAAREYLGAVGSA